MHTSWTTSCHIKPDEIDVKFFVEDTKRLVNSRNGCRILQICLNISKLLSGNRHRLLCSFTRDQQLYDEIRALSTSVCATIHVKLCEDFFVELGKYVKFAYIPLLTKFPSENTIFSRLNAGGVYLKPGLVDPAFIRGPAFIY